MKLQRLLLICAATFFVSALASAQYLTHSVSSYLPSQFSTGGEASINLYDGRDKVAILLFLPVAAEDLPAAYVGSSDGVIRLFYTADRYSDLVDMLRNSSGITVRHWVGTQGPNNSHVSTTAHQAVGTGAP